MTWYRRMRRRAHCRRKHGDNCPHLENHSRKPNVWAPRTVIAPESSELPTWQVDPNQTRGVTARPTAFVPLPREEQPDFPTWTPGSDTPNRGVGAR